MAIVLNPKKRLGFRIVGKVALGPKVDQVLVRYRSQIIACTVKRCGWKLIIGIAGDSD